MQVALKSFINKKSSKIKENIVRNFIKEVKILFKFIIMFIYNKNFNIFYFYLVKTPS
jgi:hypothetical protein